VMANLGMKLSVKTFNALLDGELKLGDLISLCCSHCATVVSTSSGVLATTSFCDHARSTVTEVTPPNYSQACIPPARWESPANRFER
jgi:hypothetical protein